MALLIRRQFITDGEQEFFDGISNQYGIIIEPAYGPKNDLPMISLTLHSQYHIFSSLAYNYYNHIDKLPKKYDSIESYYHSKCEKMCNEMKKELELIDLILNERKDDNG